MPVLKKTMGHASEQNYFTSMPGNLCKIGAYICLWFLEDSIHSQLSIRQKQCSRGTQQGNLFVLL